LCTGSSRHTSPLEINQQKFAYILDAQQRQITASPLRYNPYLQMPYPEKKLTKEDIATHIHHNFSRISEQLNAGKRTVHTQALTSYDLIYTTITITTENQTVQSLPDAFDADLLKDI